MSESIRHYTIHRGERANWFYRPLKKGFNARATLAAPRGAPARGACVVIPAMCSSRHCGAAFAVLVRSAPPQLRSEYARLSEWGACRCVTSRLCHVVYHYRHLFLPSIAHQIGLLFQMRQNHRRLARACRQKTNALTSYTFVRQNLIVLTSRDPAVFARQL